MEAVKEFGQHLSWVSDELKNDKKIVMQAVTNFGNILRLASKKFKDDKEIVKQAVQQNGHALQFASDRLKDDKEIVLLALESWKNALNYASDRLKNDRDVLFKAVSHGLNISEVRSYVVDSMFSSDRELIMISSKFNGHGTLEFACSEFKNDKEIVLQAIKSSTMAIFHASYELRTDREFMKEVVMVNGESLSGAVQFQDDKEIVELALKSSPNAYYYVSPRLRKDSAFISKLIGNRGFQYLPQEFENDRDIVLESIKICSNNWENASTELKNDREFILQVVKNCGTALEFVKEEFKNDREIVMAAVTQSGDALHFVPAQFLDDEEIILKAAETAISYCKEVFSDRLKNDREFLKKCVVFFSHFPRRYRLDRELVMETVKKSPGDVISYAYPMLISDRVLTMRIVKECGFLLSRLPFACRNDREIVSFAIKQNKEAFKFASEELQNDLEILKLCNI